MSRIATDFLVTPNMNKPEAWTYPIDHDAIAVMAKRAGRESDEGTERLTDTIGGRTVALCLNGGSIKGLEERIEDFAQFDLCWMGMNRFSQIEKRILGKIDNSFDIIFCMSEQDIPKRIPDLKEFVSRDAKHLLMTTLCAFTWLDAVDREWLIDFHGEQLYLMPRLLCRPAYPISLEVIVDELIKAKVEKLILFGADGYLHPAMEGKTEEEIIRWSQQEMLATYYDPEFFKNERRATGVGVGTVRFNKNFTYQPDKIEIVNCSPGSYYGHIPVTNYDGLWSALAVGGLACT